jgi:hypothetical protein
VSHSSSHTWRPLVRVGFAAADATALTATR